MVSVLRFAEAHEEFTISRAIENQFECEYHVTTTHMYNTRDWLIASEL